MRLNSQQGEEAGGLPLFAGSLLVAHPSLLDPNFKRTVVLLTAHSEADGSLGVVINRPIDRTLGEYDAKLRDSFFSSVPLYYGGPVATEHVVLVAWKWSPEEGSFKLYFGIDQARAQQLLEDDPGFQLRGYLGHSGWGEDQLEGEIDEGSWLISPLLPEVESAESDMLWTMILSRVSPEMRLLAEEPEDPSVN